jgi:hypothetical protein
MGHVSIYAKSERILTTYIFHSLENIFEGVLYFKTYSQTVCAISAYNGRILLKVKGRIIAAN